MNGNSVKLCLGCGAGLVPAARYCHSCGRAIYVTPRIPRFLRFLLWLPVAFCVIAWIAIAVETESVLATGPAIALAGLATAILSLLVRFWPGAAVGVCHVGICLLFVSLVNAFSWGPGAAQKPFLVMGAIYIAGIIPLTLWCHRRIPHPVDNDHCANCGYLLYGLTDPRCPECGTPFDETLVTRPD